jgi:RNA polymerase sigma-70 factor (sigma-E family)
VTIHDVVAEPEVGPPHVRRAGADDFEEFVRATGDRMYRSALLLCGDHHLAEDLTQMAYAKVFAAWPKVSAADSPVAYTRTVLLRSFLAMRRRRRLDEYPMAELPERSADESDLESVHDILVAMRRLSTDDRTILALRYWEDLSVADTADLLGIRESTCRARTSRALARLRLLVPGIFVGEERRA